MEGILRVAQITDCHIGADPALTFEGVVVRDHLRQVLAELRARGPWDALLATGDLTDDGSAEAARWLADELNALAVPVLAIPGNHDDPAVLARELAVGAVRLGGVLALGRWRLLGLDSTVPGRHGGSLSAATLAEVERVLTAEPDVWWLVAVHHQPVPVGSAWIDAMGLDNGEALLALAERHPAVRGIVWGHVHQAFEQRRDGLVLLAAPATSAQFLPRSREHRPDPSPPGWRELGLSADGAIVTRVRRLAGG